MNIKTQFPDEKTLSDFIHANSDNFTGSLYSKIGHLEAEYVASLKNRRAGSFKILIGILLPIVFLAGLDLFSFSEHLIFTIFLISLTPVSVFFLYSGWKQFKGTTKVVDDFNSKFNKELFDLVFSFFSLKSTFLYSDAEIEVFSSFKYSSVLDLLDSSELVTEPKNTLSNGDLVISSFGNNSFMLSELDVKHVTGSGKNKRIKNIFHGYFLAFDLDRSLEGKTFVSTEGDKSGFGHRSYWSSVLNKGIKETELEWNDFEKMLHVASDNPTEARYILTPDFMKDLYEWWKDKKQNIRISFIGNRMYVLFPDKRVKLTGLVENLSTREIIKNMESIALPLLHVLHLLEDANSEFNHS